MLCLFLTSSTIGIRTSGICIFGVKASQKTYEQSLKIVTDVSDILASGELNLATAGDRYKILHNISGNVKKSEALAFGDKVTIGKSQSIRILGIPLIHLQGILTLTKVLLKT